MAKAETVATFPDYEVIVPDNPLTHAVRPAAAGDDPIARAEQALEELSSEFSNWMDIECERLDAARREVKKHGLKGDARQALFHAAHDIKGEAATFGFPQAAEAASSLCRLIEHVPDPARVPLDLLDQHVDAVRAIIREHTDPGAEKTAERLTAKLREVTEDLLRRENVDRLDEIESILAPPMVPEEPAGG
jgi:HPt (histidine-containing phosphotransfer) domain-containing protein